MIALTPMLPILTRPAIRSPARPDARRMTTSVSPPPSPPHRLALIGLGRMGQTLRRLAPERGWSVVAEFGARGNSLGAASRDLGAVSACTSSLCYPYTMIVPAQAGQG